MKTFIKKIARVAFSISLLVVAQTSLKAQIGQSLNFDGSDDYVLLADPNFGTGDFTIETWFKTNSSSNSYLLTNRTYEGGGAGNWWALQVSGGTVLMELAQAGYPTGTSFFSNSGVIVNGTWNHVAIVRQGLTYRMYINGILNSVKIDIYNKNWTTGNNTMYFGRWYDYGYYPLNGNMDEVRIWTVARTQCEIQTYMNCEIPTTATNLASNYHFNQGTAASTNTSVVTVTTSAGSNNGTLINFGLTGSTSNWVTPGGVVSGYTTTTAPTASIRVTGNTNTLTPGSSVTSTLNFTDFGTSATRTFVIQNTSTGTLNIFPPYFSGLNATEFTLTIAPSLTLAASATTSFVVAFTSTLAGFRSATINIPSNDCAAGNFSCAVGGTATAAALDFDGNNNRVLIPSGININNQSFSVEFWSKRTSTLTSYVVGQGNSISNNQGLHIGFRPGNIFTFAFYSNDINYTTTATSDGVYHHWACVYDASITGAKNRFVYLDGVLVSSDISPSAYLNTGQTVIGDAGFYPLGYQNPLVGTLDEVRIWGVARSQCEVQQYMRCEITSTASGLIANYHFNQGTPFGANSGVTTCVDATGNHNGTLTNFSLSGTTSNWVIPGAVLSASTIPAVMGHTLNVTGNGNNIPAGSATPTLSNFTDFGSATTRTFVVQNIGTGTLYLNGGVFTGVNAANFSVTTIPSTLITTGGSSTLVITFTPTATGTQSAILNIYSSDCTNPTYSFVVTASTSLAAALNFDGSNDLVSIPQALPLTNMTNELWFKTTTANGGLFVSTDASAPLGVVNWDKSIFLSSGNLVSYLWTSGPAETITTSGSNFADGNWHHVAHVVNGSGQKLYVDGQLRASGTLTASGFSNSYVFLGKAIYGSGPYLSGAIDEVRMWNVARSQCEIQSYMNCEIPGSATNLLANFHFNQGIPSGSNTSVTTATTSAGSNNGTLSGFALTTGSISNWISPGPFANNYSITTPPTASIGVTGGGNLITNNASTVTSSNLTDFGTTTTSTFVIQNTNTGTLNIGTPYFTGINASEFSVTVLPASSSLAASATTSFVVAFTPTAGGIRTATVNINNNDCAKPVFNFAISAHAPYAEALSFDGADDLANRPILSTNTSSVTLQAKVYWYGSNGHNQMIMYNGTSSSTGYGIYNFSGSGDLQIILGGVSYTPFNYTLTPNVWTSLSLVLRNGLAECYANGILTNAVNIGTPGVPTGSFTIGNNSFTTSPEGFNGRLDEVRFWNKALSQCEIQTYQDCEIPGAMPNLLGNYHLDQGSPSLDNSSVIVATDDSGNSNNLNLSNFAFTGTVSNWVSPGAVVPGYTITSPPSASISLAGNANAINNSATSTSTLNFTDFGSATTRTYVITNSNSGTLTIGAPYLTGLNPSEFSITVLPSPTLSALATTSFVVAFTPTAGGVRSAVVNIINNDCSVPIFNFAIGGSAPLGAALTFDGVDDYIDLASNNLPTGNSDFTVEFWVKINSAQTFHRWIAWMGATAAGSMVTFGYDGNNGNKIRIHHLGPDLMATTASITPNVWTHVAINYKGAAYSNDIFINGNYIETLNFGVPLTLPANGTVQLGTFDGINTYCADVDLDEFRIWNRALCQTEIQNNMHCEIATTGSSLVANYHFNQGYAGVDNSAITTLTDVSGSANTGTLNGFASTGTVSNWTAPGAVTSGSSCNVYLDPEINLLGNAVNIPSGASTPSLSNFTDFGGVCSNTFVVRTFSIQNTGTGSLSVSSLSMSGTNAALFSIGALSPASPIAAGSGASFNVTLTPGSSGVKIATLTILNTDCDESVYTFVLTGTANALPVVTASASHSVICNTATTSVIGGGADTYTWTGTIAASDGIAFNPSITASYSVSGTSTLTGCTSTNIAVQTITVNALPTVSITATSSAICPGGSATLIASGGDTYTWTPGPLNTTTINPSPAAVTNYTLVGTNILSGCTSTNLAVQTISLSSLPIVVASSPNASICAGLSATLNASGASTYTWLPGPLNGSTVNPVPVSSTTYSLVGTNTAGCTSTNTATQLITVNTLPTVSINALVPVICEGSTASLSASGALTYTWNPGGLTTITISPAPVSTSVYTLSGTNSVGCTNTNIALQTITVNALPTVTASTSNSLICNTGTTSLIGLGADTYTWNPAVTNATPFSPSTTTNYTVSGTNSLTGCTSTNLAMQTISVNVSPTVALSVANGTICEGGSSTLTASNADTYTWNPGNLNAASISPTLTSTTIFTLSGSSLAGCLSVNTLTQQITVNPLPAVTASASSPAVCPGNTTSLLGGGASTYTWSSGITNGISFTPSITSTYTVIATDANLCQNSTTILVTVNALPTLSISTSKSVACEAESIVLTASGANTYTWSAGQASTTLVVTPSVTTTYSITGVDINGCMNTAIYIQSVSPCPGSMTAVFTTIDVSCSGKQDARIVITATHSYSNAEVNYIWSPSTLCPLMTCGYLENISAGNYSVTVRVTYTLNNVLVKQDSVILDSILIKDLNGPCDLKVFSGFSPNGDGKNDTWQIENIEEYPKNKVSVFNRWGVKVFDGEGYNNTSKSWPDAENANKLPTGTYFYIIELGDGSKPIKGWVELIKG